MLISSNTIALLKGVTVYVDKALIVGGSTKKGEKRRILAFVLCVIIRNLCINLRLS
jgi:hypothetical protein